MTQPPTRLASELLDALIDHPDARMRLMGKRPSLERDLAELTASGRDMCTSCADRLKSALTRLGPDEIAAVFGERATVVDPSPLNAPRVVKVGRVGDLEAVLHRLTFDDGVLIRNVVPVYEDGELHIVVM